MGEDIKTGSEERWETGICDPDYSILGRRINELIEAHVSLLEPPPDAFAFVCECENGDCEDRIQTSVQRHRLIREDGSSFMVVAGHESRDDLVVKRESSWLIVRKASYSTARQKQA
ncbi:MAG: hypothetical protein WD627_01335 [Actinomycetota bacterium]